MKKLLAFFTALCLVLALVPFSMFTVAASSDLVELDMPNNVALGKAYTLNRSPSDGYPDTDDSELTDGYIPYDYNDDYIATNSAWTGFIGNTEPLTIEVDLDGVYNIAQCAIYFCDQNSWGIGAPATVEFYGSNDGVTYQTIGSGEAVQLSTGICVFYVNCDEYADNNFMFIKASITQNAWCFISEIVVNTVAADFSGYAEPTADEAEPTADEALPEEPDPEEPATEDEAVLGYEILQTLPFVATFDTWLNDGNTSILSTELSAAYIWWSYTVYEPIDGIENGYTVVNKIDPRGDESLLSDVYVPDGGFIMHTHLWFEDTYGIVIYKTVEVGTQVVISGLDIMGGTVEDGAVMDIISITTTEEPAPETPETPDPEEPATEDEAVLGYEILQTLPFVATFDTSLTDGNTSILTTELSTNYLWWSYTVYVPIDGIENGYTVVNKIDPRGDESLLSDVYVPDGGFIMHTHLRFGDTYGIDIYNNVEIGTQVVISGLDIMGGTVEDGAVMDIISILATEEPAPETPDGYVAENLATGKNYTTSLPYRMGSDWHYDENAEVLYPDTNNCELTDGIIPVDGDFFNDGWMAMHSETPDVVEMGYAYVNMDLESECYIEEISLYMGCFDDRGIVSPDFVEFYGSVDGVDYEYIATNDWVYYCDTVQTATVYPFGCYRYIEARIYTSELWMFVSEITVTGSVLETEEPTPDEEEPTPDEEEPTPDEEEPTPDEEEPTPDEEEPTPDEEEPTPDEEEPTPDEEEPNPGEGETDGCEHNYESTVTKPTCTEDGYTSHTCGNCGDSYTDSVVPATGHNYESTVTKPTCTEDGYTTHTCGNCGDSYKDSYVDKKGHTAGDWTVVTKPEIGKEGLKKQYCTECGEAVNSEVIPALEDTNNSSDDVIYEVPEDSGIEFTENNAFESGTTVTVEEIPEESVPAVIVNTYTNYITFEITAVKDDVKVQPNEPIAVTFPIPEGFGTDVSVYYVSDDGTMELITSVVNVKDRTITAVIEHFSTYVLVDNTTKVDEKPVVLGDINNNGSVDMTDYVLAKRAYFGTYNLTPDELERADVNRSGGIDMTDYILIKRVYFGTYSF